MAATLLRSAVVLGLVALSSSAFLIAAPDANELVPKIATPTAPDSIEKLVTTGDDAATRIAVKQVRSIGFKMRYEEQGRRNSTASVEDASADGLKVGAPAAVPTMEKMEDPEAELREKERLEKMLPLLLKGALSKDDTNPADVNHTAIHHVRILDDMDVWRAACYGSRSPKKIIISLVAGKFPPGYVESLRTNRLMVAQKNNYRYCEYTHSLDDSRHIIWSKIVAVRTLLNESHVPVVWMDADAWFTNPYHNFETITDQPFMKKDAAFSADIGGRPINLGVFVTKSTTWTKHFWTDVWNDVSHLHRDFMEQGAVTTWRARHMAEFNAHAVIIPCWRMNNVGSPEGEFIAHLAGGSSSSKYHRALTIMRQIQDKFMSQ